MSQLRFLVDPDEDPRPAFLTIAEAAGYVRVCERTVRRAIEHERLRAARVRGSRAQRGAWRIRRGDLDRWMYEDGDT